MALAVESLRALQAVLLRGGSTRLGVQRRSPCHAAAFFHIIPRSLCTLAAGGWACSVWTEHEQGSEQGLDGFKAGGEEGWLRRRAGS